MRVESQEGCSNIYPVAKKSENNSIFYKEDLVPETEISKSRSKSSIDNSEAMVSYPIVYNNATLDNINRKSVDKHEDDMTDEEITYKLNKGIYDRSNLSSRGIAFNSKEFFEYLEKTKKNSPVPYDAPPKIRKILTETLNELIKKNGVVWYFTFKALVKGLRKLNTKDPMSYLNICNDTIEKNKDNVKSLVMSGVANNPLFSDSMKLYKGLIDVFTKIKSDINSYLFSKM
jgi:hypothetical protein